MTELRFLLKGNFIYLSVLLIVGTSLLQSCSKGEGEPDPAVIQTPVAKISDYIPVHPDREAVLVSIKNSQFDSTDSFNPAQVSGTARAIFPSANGYRNAGDVAVENIMMNKSSDNFYTVDADPGNQGIDFTQGNVRWTASGSPDAAALNFIVADGFPEISGFDSYLPEIDRLQNYSFGTVDPVINADSVRYVIYSPGSYIYSNRPANNHSHQFVPNLLSYLNPGQGYIRFIAFKSVEVSLNGKNYQVLNQNSIIKPVTIR